MSDLIDRQAAIDAVNTWIKLYVLNRTMANPMSIQEMISALPSAQPEIISCKDCLMHGVCRFEQGLGLDGYCSQAEPYKGEQE